MAFLHTTYQQIKNELTAENRNIVLVAVSKTKPAEDILEAYNSGHRDFGENYVQELVKKQAVLPKDIRWHFIGHLQTNKVKDIIDFVHIIHGVDSKKLLWEIDKQAKKKGKIVNCLLQLHIAREETKFGLDEAELLTIMHNLNELKNIKICGLMGMASFSNDMTLVAGEFQQLRDIFNKYKITQMPNWQLDILSMGMSSDYTIALKRGSTMVRVGSLLFGKRNR